MDALQDEAEPLPNMHYDAPVMKQLYVRGENVCGDFPMGFHSQRWHMVIHVAWCQGCLSLLLTKRHHRDGLHQPLHRIFCNTKQTTYFANTH